MEDIFEAIIRAILKVFRVVFRVIAEIFLQGIFEIFVEKCYKRYPKTTIFFSTLFLILLIAVLIYIWGSSLKSMLN